MLRLETKKEIITLGVIPSRLVEKKILRSLIEEAIRKEVEGKRLGVLFSGGLDSAVVAFLAGGMATLTTYTVGVAGCHDLKVAENTASFLGLDWVPIILSEEEMVSSIRGMEEIWRIANPLTVSFQLPTYVVAKYAKEGLLMSGQGADELFGGYARYERMPMDSLRLGMEEDLDRVMTSGRVVDQEIAAHFGKRMVHPYLDFRVVSYVRSLPFESRVPKEERKPLLREVARDLGLQEAAERPKKAAQYGSGIMKMMKAAARRRKLSLGDWIMGLAQEDKES